MSGSDHDWGGAAASAPADPSSPLPSSPPLPSLVLEDDGGQMLEGDLGDAPTCARFLDRLTKEEYYSSSRFAIGYSELQARWSGEACDGAEGGESPSPWDSSSSSPSLAARKQSLALALEDAAQDHLLAPGARRFSRRWSSSVGASPLGTPSPLLSAPPSPVPSPLLSAPPSPVPSPSQRPSASSPDCVSSSGCCTGSNDSLGSGASASSGASSVRRRRSGLMDTLRRLFGVKRAAATTNLPRSASDQQISVLEAELETYRQLSEAKRQAADLLKHQLMEVLYEKVVTEVEEKHRRRHLEEEIMRLEFQLHLLRATTEDNIRSLSTQLQSLLSERAALKRQLSVHHLPPEPESLLDPGPSNFSNAG
ncbi:uncharacterized protein LOC125037568 [Penaeus chinensis]|uniref:uncharacterized protein LOC125037568 n=1 Tax=Penaeus chinensis TaxID=139456 RepID=UPI001FB78A7F|nr:uncharacterized protein LOC125037568 [Penaeus chinensis]